ncbi:Rrf2 family transcriptional regulator [Hyphobacterium indicum]|uniref:Rrf2 family transcriptional regulator n=1 Tax=Hyphobacterium indicum TaxID=2162714 RepID=UPI000D65EDBE|nr:Rrf2 family transcriptional regulator [Hyphobacterium indicum]
MKLSTKGRYAVMAMADLARRSIRGPVTLADIASRQSISLSYLEQLFARLRKAELVDSVRGPGGGYSLARPAENIRVIDIMSAVDESVDITRCEGEARGCIENGRRCITHDLWDELSRHIYLFLGSITLEDVIAGRVMGAARGANERTSDPMAAE